MKTSFNALALVAGCFLAGSAFAQCVNDTTISASPGSFAGNTCGKNLALTTICSGGNGTNGAGTSVVQVTVGASANFGLQVVSSTAGFNPELAFTTGACSSLSACSVDDTNNTQTVPAAAAGTGYATDTNFDGPIPQPGAGTAFIFITDLNAEAPGCGAYNLSIVGTLPVKLQDFSVH